MNTLCIIPARGGSKGIPRKNIRLLNGKPLIAYTIEQAKATPSITRVVVSTDDAEIGAVAQQYGAEVVWRPADISGDTAAVLLLVSGAFYFRRMEKTFADVV